MSADRLKERLKKVPAVQEAWGTFRRRQLHDAYIRRREHYAREAQARGLVYSEAGTVAQVRSRLKDRGYSPTPRRMGEVHTFAFIPRIGWHEALFNDLRRLGPVTEFDYVGEGYQVEEFLRGGDTAAERRAEMNRKMLEALRAAHSRVPVDWVFVYASGLEIEAFAMRAISEELGVPTVNMCLDDKQSWTGPQLGAQRVGQIDIAPAFDLSWTSARVACEWYMVEGARPLYLPEGFDSDTYYPMAVDQDIPASFVGGAYGFRPGLIRRLKRYRIPVQTFGPGWPGGRISIQEQVRVFNRSRINLGIGGIGYSNSLTNVKGRDFEVPATGGGLYLTSYNTDLAQHFEIGREIACYSNSDDLVEMARHYLSHTEEAREIAERGRKRCLAEHQWLHRHTRVLNVVGIVRDG